MSIYDAIAAAILPVLPDFSVGGSTWTVTRASGDGVTSAVTVGTVAGGDKTLYFVRNKVDRLGLNMAGSVFASAEWLCFASDGTDVRVNDICTSTTDSTRKFRITGAPQDDFGLLFAPCLPA